MWHHLVSFLYQVWHNFLHSLGTTFLGWATPIVDSLLSIGFALYFISRREGREAMLRHWKQNAVITLKVGAAVTAVIYGTLLAYTVIQTVYDDHEYLVARAKQLQQYAENNKQLDEKLKQARFEAQHWQDTYERMSRGETRPDRVLSSEESNKLYEELSRVAKDRRNRDYVRLDFGSVQDREASHLATQLLQIFREAHWTVTHVVLKKMSEVSPGKPIPEDIQFVYAAPAGVIIWSDQPNHLGTFLTWSFKEAGIDATLNPSPPPQSFKGTLVWVAYKQFP